MKRIIGFVLLAILFAVPATAQKQFRNTWQNVMDATEVATGTPVTVTIDNLWHTSGYLVILTTNETATASLVVTVSNVLGQAKLVCTSTPITANGFNVILLGSNLTAADPPVTDVCIWPLSETVRFTFTTSGVGADFDVAAYMNWLVP